MNVKKKSDTIKALQGRLDKIKKRYLIEQIYNKGDGNLNLKSDLKEEYKNKSVDELVEILNAPKEPRAVKPKVDKKLFIATRCGSFRT
jgi:hypothetical protein